MKDRQVGFTLIELVVVIVILGILAATAIPRFADMSSQARAASRNGVLGAVRAASVIVHGQALVQDCIGPVDMEGVDIQLFNCYANVDGGVDGIVIAVETSIDVVTAGSTATWEIEEDCEVTYTQTTDSTVAPLIGGTSTGC